MSTARRQRRSWGSASEPGSFPPSPPTEEASRALALVLDQLARSDPWWASEESRKGERWTGELEGRYRRLYELRDWEGDDVAYDEARVAYRVGRMAADHPELGGREFGEIAGRLVDGWSGEEAFDRVRRYVELGFRRRRFSVELLRVRERVRELERRWREQ